MPKSPALVQKLKSFANKISGTSTVNNLANPNSAASKVNASMGKPNPNNPQLKYAKKPAFKPSGPTSNGIGVGP